MMMTNDLYDAIRKSIADYMQVDDLPLRQQRRVRGVYDKFVYNLETVDGLVEMPSSSPEKDKKRNESD